jgi:flagellar hook-associated protein 3 FlgL
MVADLGLSNLSPDARQTLLTQATSLLGSALAGLTGLQSNVGATQSAVDDASTRLGVQGKLIDTRIGMLQSADPAALAADIAALTTQLESAYSLTNRLSQLSLVKYL